MITIHQRHRRTYGRTDRQTTCDRNTALCTKVHRAVRSAQQLTEAHSMLALFSVCSLRDDNVKTSKPTWKPKHANSILVLWIFLPNIIIQNRSMWFRATPFQSWVVFLAHRVWYWRYQLVKEFQRCDKLSEAVRRVDHTTRSQAVARLADRKCQKL